VGGETPHTSCRHIHMLLITQAYKASNSYAGRQSGQSVKLIAHMHLLRRFK